MNEFRLEMTRFQTNLIDAEIHSLSCWYEIRQIQRI
jgi:hypothetical protein